MTSEKRRSTIRDIQTRQMPGSSYENAWSGGAFHPMCCAGCEKGQEIRDMALLFGATRPGFSESIAGSP